MEMPALTEPRLDFRTEAPDAAQAMMTLEHYVRSTNLEPSLLDLVKTRASQLNGCAFCINMHTGEARSRGESEERLYLLSAWRESSLYSERERAALAWTEAITNIQEGHAPEEVYEEVRGHFGEEELVNLTMAIVTINGWNRLAVGFRMVPGN